MAASQDDNDDIIILKDWRGKGILLGVIDQGDPGACGMIVPLECVSSLLALKKSKPPVRLSTEQLVNEVHKKFRSDCADKDPFGCIPVNYCWVSFEYVRQEGVGPDDALPYTGVVSGLTMPSGVPKTKIDRYVVINSDKPEPHAKGCEFIDKNNVTDDYICAIIEEHPICGGMSWYDRFDQYKKAIRRGAREYQHAVLIVGYGTTKKGRQFYLVKHSKSRRWGDQVFGLVSKDLVHGFSYPNMDDISVQDFINIAPEEAAGPRRSTRLKRATPDVGPSKSTREKKARKN